MDARNRVGDQEFTAVLPARACGYLVGGSAVQGYGAWRSGMACLTQSWGAFRPEGWKHNQGKEFDTGKASGKANDV